MTRCEGLCMSGEAPVSPKYASTSQRGLSKRSRLYFGSVVTSIIIVSTIILVLFFTGFFAQEAEVEITKSSLRSGERAINHRWVSVDVSLFNPGRSRRVTVWAEITDQPTQVSYSKAQSVSTGFRESQDVTIEFTLDRLIYSGEFTYRVWLTCATSQD